MLRALIDSSRLALILMGLPFILLISGPLLIWAAFRGKQPIGPITLDVSQQGAWLRSIVLVLGLGLWIAIWGGLAWGTARAHTLIAESLFQTMLLPAPTQVVVAVDMVTPTPMFPVTAAPTPEPQATVIIHPDVTDTVSLSTPEPTVTLAPATPTPSPTIEPRQQAGVIVAMSFLDTHSANTITHMSANFYPAETMVPGTYTVDRYQILFQSLDLDNNVITVRADLYIPRIDTLASLPLFVYGSGTTGIGNACAPSGEVDQHRNWGNYRAHMLSYASQGYISIFPNWHGFDDPDRIHHYFNLEMEGRIMLDATRAVYNFFYNFAPPLSQAVPSDKIFFGGYSQGGHGAFAATDIGPEYAPEIQVAGIVSHAGAPDVEALMRESPFLAPYIVHAYHDLYGIEVVDPAQIFQPQWVPTLAQDTSTKCVDEVLDYYSYDPSKIYQPDFQASLYNYTLDETFPAFHEALARNYSGLTGRATMPLLILHGAQDYIVTQKTQERFVEHLCNNGQNVTYILYEESDHYQIRQWSVRDSLAWMRNVLSGETPVSQCPAFLASRN